MTCAPLIMFPLHFLAPVLLTVLVSLAARNASDLVAHFLRKPEIAIRSRCNPIEDAPRCGDGKLSDTATGGDAPDLVATGLHKPEVAIRSRCNPKGVAPRCGGGKQLYTTA